MLNLGNNGKFCKIHIYINAHTFTLTDYYMKRFLVSAFTLFIISLSATPYAIKGKIIDSRNGNPIRKAVIIAKDDSAKFLAGLNSDQDGIFITADIKAEQVFIEISKEKFETVYMQVSGISGEQLDIGTVALKPQAVELNEVTVTAESVIQKPDRYIIIPSLSEIERSASSLSLLNTLKMKMPGLSVIEELQSVKVDNRTPVFKINGKPADMNKVLSINNDNILRIEYSDSPDIRYNSSVINFILKPRQDGGSIVTGLTSAFTTGFINGNFGATYYNKKSEWNINYGINWRDYDERVVSSYGTFYGRENPVIRETKGIPSGFGYTDNFLSLGYTYMYNPQTMFSVSIGGLTDNLHLNDAAVKTQLEGSESTTYDSRTNRQTDFKSPNIDLFFRKEFKQGQSLEINAFGRYNDGDYNREYHDTYPDALKNYDISSITDSKAWSTGGEVMYSKQFKNLTTNFGIQERYSYADNRNVENSVSTLSQMASNNLYFYGQAVGRIKSFGYSVGIGGVHVYATDQSNELNAMRLKSTVTLNYAINRHFSLNYLFMYSPTAPSLYQQSNTLQRVDDIVVRQGNMSLKPQDWFRNRIYARYNNNKFAASLWFSHSRTNNPIFYDFQYIDDETNPFNNMFLSRAVNGLHDNRFNVELNLGVSNLFNHLALDGKIGYDDYTIYKTDGKYTDKRVYASLNGALYFGDWTISANYKISPQYILSGNILTEEERWNTVRVQYKWRDFHFSLTGVNLFTDRGWASKSITLSDVHPETNDIYIKDNANMILLNISYRVNFGKGFKKSKRTLQNGGIDTGVNINY